MCIDDILEVLGQTNIKWLQIDLALHNFEQTIELIDCQVFNDSLRLGSDLLLGRALRQGLVDEVGIDLL